MRSLALLRTALVASLLALPARSAPFAFVANSGSSSVSVIDLKTLSVVDTINLAGVASAPSGIALTPDGSRAYLTSEQPPYGVLWIDTLSHAVLGFAGTGGWPNCDPYKIVLTPDGSRAYFTEFCSWTAGMIDTATNALSTFFVGCCNPQQIAISPDGASLFVSSNFIVARIATANNSFTWPYIHGPPASFWYQWPSYPGGIAVTPDGSRLYISDWSGTLRIIDMSAIGQTDYATGTPELATVPLGGSGAIGFSPDGARAYVNGWGSGSTYVVDTTTFSVLATIPVGSGPDAIALTGDGKLALVAINPAGSVAVIDTATNTVTANIAVGSNPRGIAITPGPLDLALKALARLTTALAGLSLPPGTATSLGAKLQAAQAALLAGNPGSVTSACNRLVAFDNQVSAQAGKALTADQAAQLAAAEVQIQNILCGP